MAFAFAQARAATVLPDACGSDKVKFEITTQKGQPVPVPPDPAKAQIIFVQTNEGRSKWGSTAVTRFGIDGAWAGANRGNSYFTISVDPGLHHLCSDWDKRAGIASFTAEAGKLYCYQAKTTNENKQMGNSQHPNLQSEQFFDFLS
jgi:hypothetical protein